MRANRTTMVGEWEGRDGDGWVMEMRMATLVFGLGDGVAAGASRVVGGLTCRGPTKSGSLTVLAGG